MTHDQSSPSTESVASARPTEVPGDKVRRASVTRNVVHMMSSQVVTWVLATIFAVFVPRLLGPEAQGQLRLGFSLWAIAQIFIGLGTTYRLSLEIARDREHGVTLVGPVLVVRTVAFIASSLVLAVYVIASGGGRGLAAIMALIGAQTILVAWSDTFVAAFVGLERMSVPAQSAVLGKVIGTALAVGALLAGGDAKSVAGALALSNGLALVVLAKAFRDVTPLQFRGWRPVARPLVRASLPFMLSGAILTTYQQIDTVVISLLVSHVALGWYGAADTLFGSLLFPATILTTTLFPTLGRLHVEDTPALHDMVHRAFSLLLLFGVPIGLGTTVIAAQFAPLLYGRAYAETGQVLEVLGPVIILTFCTIMFGTIALATGRERFWNILMISAVAVTVPLDVVCVPWADSTYGNGAVGGAITYLITEALMFVLGAWKIAPYLFDARSSWRWARVLIAGALMVAAAWPLRHAFLLAPIGVGAVVYVAAVLALRVVSDYERHLVNRGLVRLRLRPS